MTITQQLSRDPGGKAPQGEYDIVVIGAGFSGLYALYKLRGLADRFGIRDQVQFQTTVTRLRFDEPTSLWHVRTDRGEEVTTRFVIAATGSLNAGNIPDFKGAETFQGQWYHTSKWPKEGVDFAGMRVGIIGTGSTGIQVIPVVAEEAGHLTVFQRTANFSIPSRNRPLDPDYEAGWKQNYRKYREMMKSTASAAVLLGQHTDRSVFDVSHEEREAILELAWESRSGFKFTGSFKDVRTNEAANEIVAEFVRRKIRQTGFDAMTGSMTRMNVTGTDGVRLEDKWVDGPANYLGFLVAGFPNLFMIHGPGSPSVLAQMIMSAEWQVDWVCDRISYLLEQGYERVDTTEQWEESWAREVEAAAAADATLYKKADSWYLGANIPGKPRVFMVYVGGFDNYTRRCTEVVDNGYQGFVFR
jgi:cation diffusion facilitator CzcD-associated flavoprotein CzcO